jgi:3-oxoacyl-[acyl-carrier-protein] synthase II
MGMVGVCGVGRDALWAHLLDPDGTPGDGQIKDFDPSLWIPRRESRRMDRCTQLAVVAAQLARDDAGDPQPETPDRGAVAIGTAYGGVTSLVEHTMLFAAEGANAMNPTLGTMFPVSAPPAEVAARTGWSGPAFSLATACATGSHIVGDTARMISAGICDIALAGGTESPFAPPVIAAFQKLKVLSPTNTSRPFDADRDGFVIAEGAAVLVLEERGRALARGATIWAEVLGGAAGTDTSSAYSPSDEGEALAGCMERALGEAGLTGGDITHVNAHGTGTRANDDAEAQAIARVIGSDVPVASIKGAVGHPGGASGVFEAAAAALTITERLIPATRGFRTLDPGMQLDVVGPEPRPWEPGPVLSSSLGLGGHVACLVLAPA